MTEFENALLVDDLPDTRRWLRARLAEAFPDIGEVREAADLASGLALVEHWLPDLALLDLGLPDGSGIELVSALRLRHPGGFRVVTTIYDDDNHLFPALRSGAHGYLLKDSAPEHFVRQLRGLAQGEPPLSPSIARRMLDSFASAEADTERVPLTVRERETLILIAKGYRLNEVAESMAVTRNTAASYIKNVYRKLEVNSRAEAALAAARMGLVTSE